MSSAETPEPLRYTGHLLRRAQQVHLVVWQREVPPEATSVQFAALSVLDRLPGVGLINWLRVCRSSAKIA